MLQPKIIGAGRVRSVMSDNSTRPPASGQADSPEPVEEVKRERSQILQQLEEWPESPGLMLGFIWLILPVVKMIWGINPLFNALVYAIWAVFILHLFLRFFLAPEKTDSLKDNRLAALSLWIPAPRIGRIMHQWGQISKGASPPRGPASIT